VEVEVGVELQCQIQQEPEPLGIHHQRLLLKETVVQMEIIRQIKPVVAVVRVPLLQT
jgi:hypothetical protein